MIAISLLVGHMIALLVSGRNSIIITYRKGALKHYVSFCLFELYSCPVLVSMHITIKQNKTNLPKTSTYNDLVLQMCQFRVGRMTLNLF